MHSKAKNTRGFTLIEMLVVVSILMLVIGVIVSYISGMQKRYRVEENRLDMTQETREFMDQFTRDVHLSGFPNYKMNINGTTSATWYYAANVATGLVSIDENQVIFEGDVDGSGTVSKLIYRVGPPTGSTTCPCLVQRGVIAKTAGDPMTTGAPVFFTEVNNVINTGITGTIALSGSGRYGTDDTYYGSYKTEPVFRYYDSSGTEVTTLPVDISGTGGGFPVLKSIKTVRITLHVLAPNPDMQTGVKPVVAMSSMSQIYNY